MNETDAMALERQRLYARLGHALYQETKDDERLYLKFPELYLAIARMEDGEDARGERQATS